jgi:hypothetical protein
MSMLWHRVAEPWRRSPYGCAALRILGTVRDNVDLRRAGG